MYVAGKIQEKTIGTAKLMNIGKLLKEDEGEEKDEEKEVEARKALKVHVLMGDRTCLGRTSQQVRKNTDLLQCLSFPI